MPGVLKLGLCAFYVGFGKFPQRSRDPNNRVLGPKYCVVHSIGALKPYDLGPGTLSFGGAGFMMKG